MANWAVTPLQNMLQWYTSLATPTPPGSFYLGLSSDVAASWTEFSMVGYARQPITWVYGPDYVVSNNADIQFVNLGAGTLVSQAIWDASTAGNMIASSDLNSQVTFNSGFTFIYASGKIKLAL